MLLHCYPFVREAGWLAHVYGNVYFDLSLTIPHVARPAEALARRSSSRRCRSSSTHPTPRARRSSTCSRAVVAARRWRRCCRSSRRRSRGGGQDILRENALGLYQLE